jgi:hypothetical protein
MVADPRPKQFEVTRHNGSGINDLRLQDVPFLSLALSLCCNQSSIDFGSVQVSHSASVMGVTPGYSGLVRRIATIAV